MTGGRDRWPTENERLRRMNCKEGHVKSSKRLKKHIISISSETSKGLDSIFLFVFLGVQD